jgi:hypothetical protein
MSLKKWKNPFYALLIPVGMVFVVTVTVYFLMASVEVNATNPEIRAHLRDPIFEWINKNGTKAVTWELAILGVLTVGAIGTDHWWTSESAIEDSKDQ